MEQAEHNGYILIIKYSNCNNYCYNINLLYTLCCIWFKDSSVIKYHLNAK